MLGIGEFAGLTGLSVKALRHYDDKGVLVPVSVDEASGYRRYGEHQVRDGVVIRALRDAGVPLPDVAKAVVAGSAAATLTERRRAVEAQREREDVEFASAQAVLRGLAVPVDVVERDLPAQPFVGQIISLRADDAEALTDDDANAVFADLFARLQASGLGPSGQFWTTLRAGEQGQIEVVCCWPTTEVVDVEWCVAPTFADELPARTELVASWRPAAGEVLPEGSMHPAVVALFDAVAARSFELRDADVRQSVIGTSEDDYTVEVAVSLRPR